MKSWGDLGSSFTAAPAFIFENFFYLSKTHAIIKSKFRISLKLNFFQITSSLAFRL
jgi:hypothetical protein